MMKYRPIIDVHINGSNFPSTQKDIYYYCVKKDSTGISVDNFFVVQQPKCCALFISIVNGTFQSKLCT